MEGGQQQHVTGAEWSCAKSTDMDSTAAGAADKEINNLEKEIQKEEDGRSRMSRRRASGRARRK